MPKIMQNNRIIALDVGTKSCGVAMTDPFGSIVQPLASLQFTKEHVAFEKLLQIFQEYPPQTIVIGEPLNMDDSRGKQVTKIKTFINSFKKHLKEQQHSPDQYVWVYHDERKTTQYAEEFLITHDVSRAKRKKTIDKMAAVWILNSYLETHITK